MPQQGGESRDARRRAEDKAARAHAAQRQQDESAGRRDEWEKRRRRRFTAYFLMALGVLVAGSHVLSHAGLFQLMQNSTMEDFLIGYPTGGIRVVVGLVMLPAQRY